MTKMISWNLNGFRAIMKKGFDEQFAALDADVFCVQETKLQAGQHEFSPAGYHQYWNYAERKGYSGTAVFSKVEPLSVTYDLGYQTKDGIDREGRVITLEYTDFYLVNVYTPNAQSELARLDARMDWDDAFRTYLLKLKESKPVVVCGDLNVAHQEIDLKNPSSNRRNAGFTDEERGKFTELLEAGFVDTFRHFYPDVTERYSWWSYRFAARSRNAGWRIDYFLVSEDFLPRIKDAEIHDQIMGSDHCPVELTLNLPLQ
jgi:exodeoxyribonuclease-3